jgi:hypothetical protein
MIVCFVMVLLLIPRRTVTLQESHIRVADSENHPLSDANVTQFWRYFGLESSDHRETRKTDSSGSVMFPERWVRLNTLSRALQLIKNLDQGVHSSWGPYVDFVVDHTGFKNESLSTVIAGSQQTFRALQNGETVTITLKAEISPPVSPVPAIPEDPTEKGIKDLGL